MFVWIRWCIGIDVFCSLGRIFMMKMIFVFCIVGIVMLVGIVVGFVLMFVFVVKFEMEKCFGVVKVGKNECVVGLGMSCVGMVVCDW